MSTTDPGSTKATPKAKSMLSCNVTVDFLEGELANIPKEFKRHKKGKALSVAARQTIMNVYFSLSATYPNETFCKIVKKTAEMTGVSEKTIWRVKKEHTELNGKFKEPANKRDLMLGKKIRLARYDEVALSGIRNIVSEFINRNEIPTCKKLLEIVNSNDLLPSFGSVRTFHRLLKDMGYDGKYQLVPTDAVKHVPRKRDNSKTKMKVPSNSLTSYRNGKDAKDKTKLQVDEFNFEVKEVKTVDYDNCKIVYREECLTLYGICMHSGKNVYELIIFAPMSMMEKPVKGFSLFRMEDKQEAIGQFLLLKKILPLYYNCTPQLLVCKNLKELCDIVRREPTWTIAHIVASLGWPSCVRFDMLENLLNEVCPSTLETPIIVAVKYNRLEVIRSLMNFNINIRCSDQKGNNVYHYAASSTREIINALQCYETPSVINSKNNEGYTPLEIACIANNAECIIELLESNADMNFSSIPNNQYMLPPVYRTKNLNRDLVDNSLRSTLNGGTPLHCTELTPQCLEALVSFGCNLETKNYAGDTALAVNVSRNNMACVLSMLSHGASPNCISADGNTPLHIAVKVGNPVLIKMLALFGAQSNILNMEGITPRHLAATRNYPNGDVILFILHAMNSSRCTANLPTCSVGCSAMGDYNGIAPQKFLHLCETRLSNNLYQLPMKNLIISPPNYLQSQKLCRILCIDSGGNRAVITLQILAALEDSLGSCLIRHFDFVVGTGSGALIALALAIGKSVQQCRGLLLKLKDKLCVNDDAYEASKLDLVLQKEFGENLVMSDIKNVKLMLIGVLEDRHPAELQIFRNYPQNILNHVMTDVTYNFPIWQVAKAACSRFLIRESMTVLKEDCTINTPCLDAVTEIQERNIAFHTMNQEDEIEAIDIMISIGSGVCPGNFRDEVPLINKMASAENRNIERTQSIMSMLKVPFYRINPPLLDFLPRDESNVEVIVKAMWETTYFLNSKCAEFMELAKLLMK